MRLVRYVWKAQFTWGWLLLAAVLAFLIWLLLEDAFRTPAAPRSTADLALILEVYLPLALTVLTSRVPVLDRDEGAAELHLTWPRPAPLHLLSLLAVPLGLWAAALSATALIAHLAYAPLDLRVAASMALPPALALAGAALAGSALARHQVGGMAAGAIWWAIDLLTRGALNRWAYLFSHFRPLPEIDPAVLHRRLLLIGAAGLALALWLAGRRERWVGSSSAVE